MVGINDRWLREGHHWDLHIERDKDAGIGDAGPFTGGGWKFVIHITVSPWGAIDEMIRVLKAKNAKPHLVIGGRRGVEHPILRQLLPFDVAGRAMMNDVGDGHQTNRANAIQIEVCANPGRDFRHLAGVDERKAARAEHGTDLFALDGMYLVGEAHNVALPLYPICMVEPQTHGLAASTETARAFHDGVASWTDETYKALGNVFGLVRHRVPIPNKLGRRFTNTTRFTDTGWERAEGVVGHMHGPDDNHIDPTVEFKGSRLIHFTGTAPNQL